MRPSTIFIILTIAFASCRKPAKNEPENTSPRYYSPQEFVMGADLSYVNQIMDHGGVYMDSGKIENPYLIFKKNGANVIRLRLFNNPTWTRTVYSPPGAQMYNDYNDVKKAIGLAKDAGLQVCLDFHYSDSWADPSKQVIPAAWQSLSLTLLHDSLYNYTFKILHSLGIAGLMPEYVQTGNEINPGFLLPLGNRWNGNESNMIYLLNSAIKAVRDAGSANIIKPKIIIHIAQPENVRIWFDGLASEGLTDYDIIGFSYYYLYSTTNLSTISNFVSMLKTTFNKDVMVMETTYPWTTGTADNYPNIIDAGKLAAGYPASETGQYSYMKALTQEIIDGGGKGIFPWEPAWITSQMKDMWGTGSSWECNTFFDFQGNSIKGIQFMTYRYNFPGK